VVIVEQSYLSRGEFRNNHLELTPRGPTQQNCLMNQRRSGIAAVVMMASVALTGCVQTTGCPAIGWINTVQVSVTGDEASLGSIESCFDAEGCFRSDGAERNADGSWTVSIGMTEPDTISVSGYDSSGALLTETTSDLDWRQVGGSEQCGGPAEASALLDLTL